MWESAHDIMNQNLHGTVTVELYLIELFKEVIRQIRNETPGHFLDLSELENRHSKRPSDQDDQK